MGARPSTRWRISSSLVSERPKLLDKARYQNPDKRSNRAYHKPMDKSKKTQQEPGHDGRFVRSAAWVDRKLTPLFGPPPLGPYSAEEKHAAAPCPVCGHPMGEHVIDHTTPNAILNCPAPIDRSLEHETSSPLDELGMPLREPRRSRANVR